MSNSSSHKNIFILDILYDTTISILCPGMSRSHSSSVQIRLRSVRCLIYSSWKNFWKLFFLTKQNLFLKNVKFCVVWLKLATYLREREYACMISSTWIHLVEEKHKSMKHSKERKENWRSHPKIGRPTLNYQKRTH